LFTWPYNPEHGSAPCREL